MITRMRVAEIEAKRNEGMPVKGFDVLFNVEDVKVEQDTVKIRFLYTANYKDNAGVIKIRGEIVSKEEKDTLKTIEDGLKAKKLPPEYMQNIVNAINHMGTANATLVASILNVVPPIRMPLLKFKKAPEKKAAK